MSQNLDEIRTKGLDSLKASFGEEAVEKAVDYTGRFMVEIPGWQVWQGFGGGGRFEEGGRGGAAQNTIEIARDIGFIHKITKSTETVGLHILWFLSKDGITGDFETALRVKEELEDAGNSAKLSLCLLRFGRSIHYSHFFLQCLYSDLKNHTRDGAIGKFAGPHSIKRIRAHNINNRNKLNFRSGFAATFSHRQQTILD